MHEASISQEKNMLLLVDFPLGNETTQSSLDEKYLLGSTSHNFYK